jgi:glycogen operon protein
LADLVSYNQKHNQANGQSNHDGSDDNRSWNCGVEGPTDDPIVLALRGRQARNFLASLLLSQGVPMILGGDELGRTQRGNNNAYCQDNESSWYDWARADIDLVEWTRYLIALRRSHPVFCRRRFFQGRPVRRRGREGLADIAWFRPDGEEMTDADWETGYAKSLGVFLNGHAIPDRDRRGQEMRDDSFYLLFNAWEQPIDFTLPAATWARTWALELDTAVDLPPIAAVSSASHLASYQAGSKVPLLGRHLILLKRH